MANKCPVCLKQFDRRSDLRQHMKRKGHTIDGIKPLARQSDDARMAAYHREKIGDDHVVVVRYGK